MVLQTNRQGAYSSQSCIPIWFWVVFSKQRKSSQNSICPLNLVCFGGTPDGLTTTLKRFASHLRVTMARCWLWVQRGKKNGRKSCWGLGEQSPPSIIITTIVVIIGYVVIISSVIVIITSHVPCAHHVHSSHIFIALFFWLELGALRSFS